MGSALSWPRLRHCSLLQLITIPSLINGSWSICPCSSIALCRVGCRTGTSPPLSWCLQPCPHPHAPPQGRAPRRCSRDTAEVWGGICHHRVPFKGAMGSSPGEAEGAQQGCPPAPSPLLLSARSR